MACMCGDIFCGSCGPAQGNFRCPYCGAWSANGGCQEPDKCNEAGRICAEAEAQEVQWEKDHLGEIDRAVKRV